MFHFDGRVRMVTNWERAVTAAAEAVKVVWLQSPNFEGKNKYPYISGQWRKFKPRMSNQRSDAV